MPCTRPIPAWRKPFINAATGKRGITFDSKQAARDMPLSLPCGQCNWCRLENSRGKAVRAAHEASLYPQNCFITLTYSEENLPRSPSGLPTVDYDHPVDFINRLRGRLGDHKVRSFGCCEYGDQGGRPHYHICLFNYKPSDLTFYKQSRLGDNLYNSEFLSDVWHRLGHVVIGDLTFESAAYVARYVTKKITGDLAVVHYGDRLPEKAVCVSKGLGRDWLAANWQDIYPKDYFHLQRGSKLVRMAPVAYYDRWMDKNQPKVMAEVRKRREYSSWKLKGSCSCLRYCLHVNPDNDFYRLRVKEYLLDLNFKKLERVLENETSDVHGF